MKLFLTIKEILAVLSMDSKKGIVFPGEFLAIEEEFAAGANTFIDDEGKIRADSIGVPSVNAAKREMEVFKKPRAVKPAGIGSVVFGRIMLVKDNMAVIELLAAESNGEPRSLLFSSGSVMVSRVSQNYVKNLHEEFCIGDLVKAKIIEVNDYGVELSTSEQSLGVVKAYCTQCRQEMGLFAGKLKCTSCGSMEGRKLSGDYMLVKG